jgi:hypothetical protein
MLCALLLAAAPACALTQDLSGWEAALAGGETDGFETARLEGRGVESRLAHLAPLSPGEVVAGEPAGGALGLARAEGLGLSGLTVSTRDLAWPYGFVLELARPAAALDMAWAAANADWRATAYDPFGARIGETVIAPGTGRLRLALEAETRETGGIARLELVSLGGYDWLHLDDLRLAETPQAALPVLTVEAMAALAPPPSSVPLPAPLLLLAAGLAALPALRRRG